MALKIRFDPSNTPELPTIILATKSGEKLGEIKKHSVTIKDCLNDAAEISFTVNKYENGIKNPLWDKIKDFRLVWCKEWDIWFQIDVEIKETADTAKEVHGTRLCAAELSQVNLYNIEINTETDIARDDYTKPTVLFNEYSPEASLLNRITEKIPHYTLAHVDATIADIQRTFSFNDISIYDAFQKIAQEIGCIFVLHSDSDENGKPRRAISVYDLESNCRGCGHRGEFTKVCPECGSIDIDEGYGSDTTIFITSDELADNIQLSSDVDSVKNCFKLEAGDDLMTATIRNCNPNGSDYIWYNRNEDTEDMTEALVKKLNAYQSLYNYYQKDYIPDTGNIMLAQYNALVTKYRIFNDELEKINTPIKGYPALMTAYYNTIDLAVYLESTLMPNVKMSETNALAQAQKLSQGSLSQVSVTNIRSLSLATADSAVLSMARAILDARYQVSIKSSSLSGRIWRGNFTVTNYSDDSDTASSSSISITINDDYESFVQQKIQKLLNKRNNDALSISGLFQKDYSTFCNELKKYCLNRLTSFLEAGQSCIDILIEQGIANKDAWSGKDSNLYDNLYLPYYQKLKAIEKELKLRQSEIDLILGTFDKNGNLISKGVQSQIGNIKNQIQKELNFQEYLGKELWHEFCIYRREDTYSNPNYISDGLNNAELFEKALEFLKTANTEIYKSAELQHSIISSLKNLFAMEKFKPFAEHFEVGNWLRIRIDDKIYKLRLLEYEIYYDNLENISVTFSDVVKVLNGSTDIESILNQSKTMGTSYDTTKKQANQGANGNKLLNHWVEKGLNATNMKIIGGADNQTQTWDEHGMLFRKYNYLTDDYYDEQLKIINATIAITNDNWKTIRTALGAYYYVDPVTGEQTYAYGIIAETLVGKLILGENLGIYSGNGSMTFDQNGLCITNNVNTFVVNPNSDTLLSLSNKDHPILYVDDNGELHIRGDGSALDITANDSINGLSSRITQSAEKIETEVKRAKEVEGQLSTRITQTAEIISSKVSKNEFGTEIQQNWNSVKIAWNNISKYIQFENGELCIYDSANVATQQLVSKFNYRGNHYYRDGYYVGEIACNQKKEYPNRKGLAFDLEYEGKYMTFAQRKDSADDYYTTMLTFSRENGMYENYGIHLGCEMYLHYCQLYFGDTNESNYIKGYTNGFSCYCNELYRIYINSILNTSFDTSGVSFYKGLTISDHITVNNNTAVNIYSNIDMHNFSILNNSDIRLKKNILNTDIDPLATLEAIQLKQFDWRETNEHVNVGMIAQQVESISDEFVNISEDGLYSLKLEKFIPYLIGAIQCLSQKVNELESAKEDSVKASPLKMNRLKVKSFSKAEDLYSREEIAKALELSKIPAHTDIKPIEAERKIVTIPANI